MIKLININKSFDNLKVLNSFTLNIENGETVAIMGKSGEGKTTVLNIIAGLIKPDSGEITGVPQNISMVFQENRLLNEFSGIDNIVHTCNANKSDIKNHFKLVGLEGWEYKPVNEYSGGMKRRVAIVRAIMAKSDLILLDEPFKGLDADTKFKVINYVRDNIGNRTCIIVTHDISEANILKAKQLINI
ncbi:MAG: ABC transporter ATP-binding protein [Christensenellaceae bacterium]|nr:ABC transporter ATP-binding protein [Christensenellaceae bacterium]